MFNLLFLRVRWQREMKLLMIKMMMQWETVGHKTVSTIHLAVPPVFHTFQLDLNMVYKVSDKSRFFYTIILWRGKMIKQFFLFPAIHYPPSAPVCLPLCHILPFMVLLRTLSAGIKDFHLSAILPRHEINIQFHFKLHATYVPQQNCI